MFVSCTWFIAMRRMRGALATVDALAHARPECVAVRVFVALALATGAACARDSAPTQPRESAARFRTPAVASRPSVAGVAASFAVSASAADHVAALANSTQITRWFYFQDGSQRWFIVDGAGNIYYLDSTGAQYSGGIGWRPVNSADGTPLTYPPFPAAGRNFNVAISADGRTVTIGVNVGTTLPVQGATLPSSTRAVAWLYFQNPSTGWYITDATDASRVYFLDRADPSISGGIGWQPVSNATYPNYSDAGQIFSSIVHGSGNLSTVFGSAVHATLPTVAVSVSPATVSAGQNVVVSWSSTGTTSCFGNWSGAASLALSSSATLTVTQATTFAVTCSGPGGTTSDSKTVSVTSVGGSLSSPTLKTPTNGSTTVSINPTFAWSNVSGANRYWLTVAANAADLPTSVTATSCANCIISGNTDQLTYTTPSAFPFSYHSQTLAPGTTYYWKVQSYVLNGAQGPFSSVGSFTTAPASGGNYVDDYPFPTQSPALSDPYTVVAGQGFFYRECTSFVAWRLNRDAGTKNAPYFFTNHMGGGHWGDASTWIANAQSLHYTVNKSPAVGSVAWFSYGHVAYVERVNGDGTVDVSEYNYHKDTNPHTYSARLGLSADWYIHVLR
ncbi:MAG: hypothetical protein JWM41_1919 [Gemmatimonadetes bacterium]|nr:hypothetical protein [Gemmatimonadota bacterium]